MLYEVITQSGVTHVGIVNDEIAGVIISMELVCQLTQVMTQLVRLVGQCRCLDDFGITPECSEQLLFVRLGQQR